MRLRETVVSMTAVAAVSSCAFGQAVQCVPSRSQDGAPIVVWVVHEPVPRPTPIDISTYREQTSGSFGTPSSNVGTVASAHGTSASNVGTNASNHGTSASNVGTTAGSFGTAASDAGVSASDVGQTAGSFGDSLGTIADAANRTAPPGAPIARTTNTALLPPVLGTESSAGSFRTALHVAFNQATPTRFIDVPAEGLQDRLGLAARNHETPDLLIGSGLSRALLITLRNSALNTRSAAAYLVQRSSAYEDEPGKPSYTLPTILIMANAPHADAARDLIISLGEGKPYVACAPPVIEGTPQDASAATEVALNVMDPARRDERAAQDIDADSAEFVSQPEVIPVPPTTDAIARGRLTSSKVMPRVDVLREWAYGRLAVVTLRETYSLPTGFFVYHPLVILRRNDAGDWKVMHVANDLEPGQQAEAYGFLQGSAVRMDGMVSKGISQASPPENDNRSPIPELWWDNHGGSALQVVEWEGGGYPYTHLFFARDVDPKTQTRVRALFAHNAGHYRWRVWSIGDGGTLVLSRWRSFNVVK